MELYLNCVHDDATCLKQIAHIRIGGALCIRIFFPEAFLMKMFTGIKTNIPKQFWWMPPFEPHIAISMFMFLIMETCSVT